ncbi:MAG: hypothetical protein ACI8TQ_002878 [Planctomycetota bacterium]|jgi:hypothetical protein
MPFRFIVSFCLVCFVFGQAAITAQAYSDEQLNRAWELLPDDERDEICEWFRYESQVLNNKHSQLIRLVGDQVETDRGFWPLEGPKSFFAPSGKRQRVDAAAQKAIDLRVELGIEPKQGLWSYDFASRRLVRHGELRDPDRIFREALLGHSPDFEFTLFEVCRKLDDGALLDAHAALSHAYSNSDGEVFPNISIFDYLSTGKDRMLCEEDALGVLSFVEDELASDSASKAQPSLEELNRRVRVVFEEAKAGRELIETMAQVYLNAKPELPEIFGDVRELHGLWITVEGDPESLVDALPSASQVSSYLKAWRETFRVNRLRTEATYRQRDLALSEREVRALFIRVMEQSGAFAPRPVVVVAEVSAKPEPAAAPSRTVPMIVLDPEQQAKLFKRVDKAKRRDRLALIEQCLEAANQCGAPQIELVKLWAGKADFKREDLPERTVIGSHDAKVYGGGPKRKTIGVGNKKFDRFVPQVEREAAPAEDLRVDYEVATDKIISLGRRPEDGFEIELLLRGILPDEDLARAMLLSSFAAKGQLRIETQFFAHDYADRDGRAYGGVSLGEVWSSSVDLEVPDVDALAYIRTVWEDTSVKPPLSGLDHSKWYPRISSSLKKVRHRKQLTQALASIWFDGRPAMANGYDASIDVLHALVAKSSEDSSQVLGMLDMDGTLFVQRGLKRIIQIGDTAWNAGNQRRDELSAGREQIRQAVLKVLKARGWLEG